MYRRSALALAALFALLACLVAAGAFTHVDQWAVQHAMPGADERTDAPSQLAGLVPLLGAHWENGWQIAANVVALPAAFLIAVVLVAWRSRLLAVVLLACVAVELLCKELLTRPDLFYLGLWHIEPFDSSFPSGHTLRTVLIAAAFWPLLRWWSVAWAIAAIALILLAGWHTPTDVLGGVLLGLLGAAAAGALRARRLRAPARA